MWVERVWICCGLGSERGDLYAWMYGGIDNDFIYFIVGFHLNGFVVDMLCVQGIEVDYCDRKTYQKLQYGQSNQIPRVNHQTLIVLVLWT